MKCRLWAAIALVASVLLLAGCNTRPELEPGYYPLVINRREITVGVYYGGQGVARVNAVVAVEATGGTLTVMDENLISISLKDRTFLVGSALPNEDANSATWVPSTITWMEGKPFVDADDIHEVWMKAGLVPVWAERNQAKFRVDVR